MLYRKTTATAVEYPSAHEKARSQYTQQTLDPAIPNMFDPVSPGVLECMDERA